MIINTGMRTDIPAFYFDWFVNRLKAGFVLVRNPYNVNDLLETGGLSTQLLADC